MNASRMSVVLGLAVGLAACVPSLHPLYTEKDIVFDERLLGEWVAEEPDDITWTFEKRGDGDEAYTLIYTEGGTPAKFEVHLVQLKDYLFMDTFPIDSGFEHGALSWHFVPAHHFWRVWIEGDKLRAAVLDPDWVGERISKWRYRVAHEAPVFVNESGKNGSLLLTAPTRKLQKFILKCAKEPDAFVDALELHRKD